MVPDTIISFLPTDLDGNPRTIGSSVDRGAYETDQIFAGDFETP